MARALLSRSPLPRPVPAEVVACPRVCTDWRVTVSILFVRLYLYYIFGYGGARILRKRASTWPYYYQGLKTRLGRQSGRDPNTTATVV